MKVKSVPLVLSTLIFCMSFILGNFFSLGGWNSEYLFVKSDESPLIHSHFQFIFTTNLKSALYNILGAFTMGTITLANLIFNGVLVAYLVENAIQNGAPMTDVLLLILPHGIFEIPAIIIAGAAGFKIPYEITRYLAGKKEQILTKEDIKEYLVLALISIILIVIAAWIEANITLRIAETMLNSTKSI